MVGFVEYDTYDQAVRAREALTGYKFDPTSSEGIGIDFSHSTGSTSSSVPGSVGYTSSPPPSRSKRFRDPPSSVVGSSSPSSMDFSAYGRQNPYAALRDASRSQAEASPYAAAAAAAAAAAGFYAPFGTYMAPAQAMAAGAAGYFPPFPLAPNASSTLYVEGLPPDASEREVAHIFRPYAGFQSIRLVPKESRVPGRFYNLCFVEFDSKMQATVAMTALQGYRMDLKGDTKGITISFAKTERSGGGGMTSSPSMRSPATTRRRAESEDRVEEDREAKDREARDRDARDHDRS